MYEEYSFREFHLDNIIEELEQAEYPLDEDIHLDEIFPQGNIWAATPEELAAALEEYPALERYISS